MEKSKLYFSSVVKLIAAFAFLTMLSLLSACNEPEPPAEDPIPNTPVVPPVTPPVTPPVDLNKGEPNDIMALATSLNYYSKNDSLQLLSTTDVDYYSVKNDISNGYWDIYAIYLDNLSANDIMITLYTLNGEAVDSLVCPPGIKSTLYFAAQSGPTSARYVKVVSKGTITSPAFYKIKYDNCLWNDRLEPNDIFADAGPIGLWDTEFVGRIIKTTTNGAGDYDFIELIVPARVRIYYKVIAGAGATITYDQLTSNGTIYGSTKSADSNMSYYYDNTSFSMVSFYFRVGGVVGKTGGSYAFQMTYSPLP